MLDMTKKDGEQERFITDLKINEKGNMVITYADGTVSEEKFTKHNMGFYRDNMVKQAEKFVNPKLNSLGLEYLKVQGIRFGLVLLGIVGMYFTYNVDIHVIMKIVLTLLIIGGELLQWFIANLYTISIEDDSLEAFAYEEYLKHLNNFRYYDSNTGSSEYIFPIEDIEGHRLTATSVQEIDSTIQEMKDMGAEEADIKVDYTKIKRH